MATNDDYGQGVSIAARTDQPDAEALARNIANAIVARSIMRFPSASTRNATLVGIAAPVEGMTSWLQDVNRTEYYDGTAWYPVRGQYGSAIAVTGSASTSTEVTSGMAVTVQTRAGVTYRLLASGLLRSTVGSDRMELRIRRGTTTAGTQVGGGVVGADTPNTGYTCTAVGSDTPGAGSTTWTVFVARSGGSGSIDLTASAALPGLFEVKEA